MKKLCLLVLCLALLTGCGSGRETERRQQLAEALSDRRDLGFTADVRAEYPDKTVSYRLSYEEDDGGCTVRVLEPEEIGGVSVHLGPDGAQLRFEELRLDTGPLDRYGLSPLSALPALTRALREGHLESAWTEGELSVWELIAGDHLTVQVWLDAELVPQRAELISDGRVSVFLELSDWNAVSS
jgi:hypothetical protein